MIKSLNIRSSAYRQLWGANYKEHVILWPGSVSSKNLDEIRKISPHLSENHICSNIDFNKASEFCRKMYKLFLNHITFFKQL